jgi:hypothetical protein
LLDRTREIDPHPFAGFVPGLAAAMFVTTRSSEDGD